MTPFKCPMCNKMSDKYPALSRKDNKTEICSECGVGEALTDYFLSRVMRRDQR